MPRFTYRETLRLLLILLIVGYALGTIFAASARSRYPDIDSLERRIHADCQIVRYFTDDNSANAVCQGINVVYSWDPDRGSWEKQRSCLKLRRNHYRVITGSRACMRVLGIDPASVPYDGSYQ